VKNASDKAYSRGAKVGSIHVEVPKEENMVDMSLLPKKERNKILNQRTRDAKKEATVATEMEARKLRN
jgi:hypothetical protein